MIKKSIAITAVSAASMLSVVAITTPFAYASTESETETEQEIKQKNVCSGWAICANESVNTEIRFSNNNRFGCWIPLIIECFIYSTNPH